MTTTATLEAPPEKLLPARAALTTKLDQLERAMGDLADYTARCERAGVDENRAMEDEELSEKEAAEKIQAAQLQKSVFKARIANREKAIAGLSKEVAVAFNQATPELRGLVNAEESRREDIFGQRIVAALEVGNDINPARMKMEVGQLLQFCGPLRVVRALAPSYGIVGNTDNLVPLAKDILTKFEQIIEEAGRTL